jgi:Kef-type K+ transport system membrane component KefB
MSHLTREVAYLVLIVGLMVIPRALQRWRLPAPLTSFGLGMIAALFFAGAGTDPTLALLATLGISSLFLFAGLEIEPDDLSRGRWPLIGHLAVRSVTLTAVMALAMRGFGFEWQAAALLALALLTPSTGFIIDTLPALGLDEHERYWVRIKAISGEILALLVLFVVLQSSSWQTLAWSSAALVLIMVGLPAAMLVLGRSVVPYAQGSEFSLLVMLGVIAAFLTHEIGVYYLVGAFLAGFIARLLKPRLPRLASDANLHAVRMFASFFVPFYFFHNGANVPTEALGLRALGIGVALTVVVLPLRVAIVWVQRRIVNRENARSSLRVAAALTPTLIFTLVLATILRERFQIADALYGGLLFYAGASTLLPSLVLARPIDFEIAADDEPRPAEATNRGDSR